MIHLFAFQFPYWSCWQVPWMGPVPHPPLLPVRMGETHAIALVTALSPPIMLFFLYNSVQSLFFSFLLQSLPFCVLFFFFFLISGTYLFSLIY